MTHPECVYLTPSVLYIHTKSIRIPDFHSYYIHNYILYNLRSLKMIFPYRFLLASTWHKFWSIKSLYLLVARYTSIWPVPAFVSARRRLLASGIAQSMRLCSFDPLGEVSKKQQQDTTLNTEINININIYNMKIRKVTWQENHGTENKSWN